MILSQLLKGSNNNLLMLISLSILFTSTLILGSILIHKHKKEKKITFLLFGILQFLFAYYILTDIIKSLPLSWVEEANFDDFLIDPRLAISPLIYLCVRSILISPFEFQKRDWLHFIPFGVWSFFRLAILLHDIGVESGESWELKFKANYGPVFEEFLIYNSQLLYYAFTIQIYLHYRERVKQYFSNTFPIELTWIEISLIGGSIFLFLHNSIMTIINTLPNGQMKGIGEAYPWFPLSMIFAYLIYFGFKSLWMDLDKLHEKTTSLNELSEGEQLDIHDFKEKIEHVKAYIENKKVYLEPDLTVSDLAKGLKLEIRELTTVINKGMYINFNQLINSYRVEEVKAKLQDPQNNQFSLFAIALDCGFKSKATFNRVFKQMAGQSPSKFKAKSQRK